ncbi:MAG: oxidase [Acetobacteraceae bacterium]|nr:oxidase [Acetobacteraceae bacterium]
MRRRDIIVGAGALIGHEASAATMPWLSPDLPDGTRAEAHLVQTPGKQPLIQLSDRPPNLETPIQAFRTAITPNDQFFVRYHLAGIPDEKSLDTWNLEVGGDAAERTVKLTAQQLNDLPQTEITAVCQCSGNGRGLVQPHVPGVQWGRGGMGCATWHGPRLRDVLGRAGVKSEAVEVWVEGADLPAMPGTPEFRKSLPLSRALAAETIVATTMNGGPLPLLNGFPARLVVPGWTATYWMKHLTRITISAKPLDSFWMKKAYRVPAGLFPVAQGFATQDDASTWPITDIVVNSLIATPIHGEQVERSGFTVRGIAWDNGSGIQRVDVSLDGGKSWLSALLDRELSLYSFRTWRLESGPLPRGTAELRVRATSNSKRTQPEVWPANPAGYHNNVPQRLTVKVA